MTIRHFIPGSWSLFGMLDYYSNPSSSSTICIRHTKKLLLLNKFKINFDSVNDVSIILCFEQVDIQTTV